MDLSIYCSLDDITTSSYKRNDIIQYLESHSKDIWVIPTLTVLNCFPNNPSPPPSFLSIYYTKTYTPILNLNEYKLKTINPINVILTTSFLIQR